MEDDRVARAREAVRKVKRNPSGLFTKEVGQKFYRAFVEVQDVDMLVALAREGDKDAMEVLRKHARGARGAGMVVSPSLHEFVWEWFIDGPPKAKSGSHPKDTAWRDIFIAWMVKIVSQDFGLPEYRNPEHRGEDGPMTAPLLVAQELGLSDRTVEDIWAAHKPSILAAQEQRLGAGKKS
jgi:hypothetical protein